MMFNCKCVGCDLFSYDISLIVCGIIICGDVYFIGVLYLDGCIEGVVIVEVEDVVLIVSDYGQVIGEICVLYVVVNGCIDGNVFSDVWFELVVQVCIFGDVYYCLLEMVVGVQVNGCMVYVGVEVVCELIVLKVFVNMFVEVELVLV